MVQPRPPRLFAAADILSGKVNLDHYPFRYICVAPSLPVFALSRSDANALIDVVLTAAEFLETRGWEVVSFEQNGILAYLRRRR